MILHTLPSVTQTTGLSTLPEIHPPPLPKTIIFPSPIHSKKRASQLPQTHNLHNGTTNGQRTQGDLLFFLSPLPITDHPQNTATTTIVLSVRYQHTYCTPFSCASLFPRRGTLLIVPYSAPAPATRIHARTTLLSTLELPSTYYSELLETTALYNPLQPTQHSTISSADNSRIWLELHLTSLSPFIVFLSLVARTLSLQSLHPPSTHTHPPSPASRSLNLETWTLA